MGCKDRATFPGKGVPTKAYLMRNPGSCFVIGGGGREHALVWHIRRFHPGLEIFCAPGNPGISRLATCISVALSDVEGLAAAASSIDAGLTIVGPEAPLVAGIGDRLGERGLSILGPSAKAAELEGSKAFAKELMRRTGVPTAEHATFDDPDLATEYIESASGPLVVKADGLASGKGVFVCDGPREASAAARAMLAGGAFGEAGRRVVVERRLEGEEVSVFALVHGEAFVMLPAAQDHKRAYDGDRGPNTGGMGAAAPFPLPADLRDRIGREIVGPIASAMCAAGRPYSGVLFVGLMLTRSGPMVLEFNCRLGDPEAQAILPLLEFSMIDAFVELREGRAVPTTAGGDVGRASLAIVLAAPGYPGSPRTGTPIEGLEEAGRDALVFQGGTAERDGRLVTSGGRVLTIVGVGSNLEGARELAYRAAGQARFDGVQFRGDIGARLLAAAGPPGGVGP